MKLLSPAAHAEFINAIPDALRPSWFVDTWGGSFGSKGLQAEVHRARSTVLLGRDGMHGSGMASGRVFDAYARVGKFVREATLDPSGTLNVEHMLLTLKPRAQGTGFARQFNDHAFERYASADVDTVSVHAALSVGGYAWARQGFDLAVRGTTESARARERARLLTSMVDDSAYAGLISSTERRSVLELIARGPSGTPGSITGVQELANHPLGRRILLGSNWEGVRAITHSDHWSRELAGATRDALTGASLVHRPGDAGTITLAARRAAAHLPAAFDVEPTSRLLEERTGGRVTRAMTRVSLSGSDDSVADIGAAYLLDTHRGSHRIDVSFGRWRGTKASEHGAGADVKLRDALDSVWSDLDVTTTRSI